MAKELGMRVLLPVLKVLVLLVWSGMAIHHALRFERGWIEIFSSVLCTAVFGVYAWRYIDELLEWRRDRRDRKLR